MSIVISGVRGRCCKAIKRFSSGSDKELPKKDKASLKRIACASNGCGSTPETILCAADEWVAGCCANDIAVRYRAATRNKRSCFFSMMTSIDFDMIVEFQREWSEY